MPLLQFQNELAMRNINIHYDGTDLDVDLKNFAIIYRTISNKNN
ncbi:MAG: hypothetical protein RLZZ86_557 [Cyanobacteriota bacterium]|jgi:predicted HTH domain antitoxin